MEGMYLLDQPQLLLSKQTSLSTENISKNGIQKKVHYVVKNQPFSVEGTAIGINLHQHLLQARLLYDSEDLKEVGFIKLKPIEHKSNINERGDKFQIELRLKVLSSQLEDMLFRVELFVQLNHLEFGRTSVLTHPIKVVSKPEQGIKKKKEPVIKVEPKEEKSEAKVSRKRTANDMLVQSLARIEQNCESQSLSLEQLMQPKGEDEPLPKKQMLEPISPSPKPDKFTLAFQQCVDVFVKMASEDRPEKIRKMISNRSTKEKDVLTELIEEIYLQQSSKEQTAPRHFNKECQCTECPHKMELQRIDHFFNDFLSVPHGIHANF